MLLANAPFNMLMLKLTCMCKVDRKHSLRARIKLSLLDYNILNIIAQHYIHPFYQQIYNLLCLTREPCRPVGPTTGSPTVTVLRLNSDHEL